MTARVVGVVLAAGRSTRLAGGLPKQLLRIDGEPLVCRVARAALDSGLDDVVAVLGHDAGAVGAALDGLAVRTVTNPDYRDGQSTSVRAGLASLPADAAAAIFLPADQPWLTSDTIDRLVAAWRGARAPIVVPTSGGRRGAPALFDRSLFAELEALRGDVGGRALLSRHAKEIVSVDVDDPRELADVDTFEDLRAWNDA